MGELRKKYIQIKKFIFHLFAEKPTVDAFAPNLAQGVNSRTYYLCEVLYRSVQGFRFYRGSKFALLH